MFIYTTLALRIFGLAGVIGSLIFICGDLLYNHVSGSAESPASKMGKMAPSRLLAAGSAGLVGCWFYLLGVGHICLAFRPAGDVFAFILMAAFIAVMVGYGVAHTAYFAIGAGAQTARKAGLDMEEGGRLGNALFGRLSVITYLPVAVSSLMMIYAVVAGRSLYPVWMVIFLPVVIYLLKRPVIWLLRGHIRELVNDSYDNIAFLAYFLISTIVLWNAVVV